MQCIKQFCDVKRLLQKYGTHLCAICGDFMEHHCSKIGRFYYRSRLHESLLVWPLEGEVILISCCRKMSENLQIKLLFKY